MKKKFVKIHLLWSLLIFGMILFTFFLEEIQTTRITILLIFLVFLSYSIWSSLHYMKKFVYSNSDDGQFEVLRKYRHDWMNRLQILFSFMQLNKYDKANEYIKSLLEHTQIEREILQIGSDVISGFFLSRFQDLSEIHFTIQVKRRSTDSVYFKNETGVLRFFEELCNKLLTIKIDKNQSKKSLNILFEEHVEGYRTTIVFSTDDSTMTSFADSIIQISEKNDIDMTVDQIDQEVIMTCFFVFK